MSRERKNEFMISMFGDVIDILTQLGFNKDDLMKYTTVGVLTQLHKYNQDQIKRIVKSEILRNIEIKKYKTNKRGK